MRIGIDLGGTKIEGVVMAPGSRIVTRERVATPSGDYAATVHAIVEMVARLETHCGGRGLPVGIGTPGAVSPATGRMKNCNSTRLNGQPLKEDLEHALGRKIRIANDADCLALSETCDGAAAGARTVFAVILGTGVGGGIVVNGALLGGPNAIAGEWGHNPLPWPQPEWNEVPGTLCWCGRPGCIETWLAGPALAADHRRTAGETRDTPEIARMAEDGDAHAGVTLSRYEHRLARALAHVINMLDPDVIVLGGGVSRVQRLYRNVPPLWNEWVFSDRVDTAFVPALHGDASGVRGAAWLWPENPGLRETAGTGDR